MNRKNSIAVAIISVVLIFSIWFLYPTMSLYMMKPDARQQYIQLHPEVMKKVLNLGLDLQGGMHLVLEVDRSGMKEGDKDILDRAYIVIENRINALGVAEPNIQKEGSDRLVVELPGLRDERAAKQVLGSTALLEFNLVREPAELKKAIDVVDKILKGEKVENLLGDTTKIDTAKESKQKAQVEAEKLFSGASKGIDTTQNKENVSAATFTPKSLSEYLVALGSMIGVDELNRPKVDIILKRKDVQEALERSGLGGNIFLWAHEVEMQNNLKFRALYYLKKKPELTGDILKDAQWQVAQSGLEAGQAVVNLEMNKAGAMKFSRVTGANVNKFMAIVLDSTVYSAPQIRQKISEGRAQITGNFTTEEAKNLSVVLRAGALPAPVKIIEERTVGPSLGEDSIKLATNAFILAFISIFAFMLLYYRFSGLLANIALFFNIFFVLAVMASIGTTLTLPGIGGLILTVGMSIDANVIIFERIREELAIGKTVRSAIDAGYKRAFITIMDSNLTTLITFFVLLYYGTGSAKGFAVTSILGIIVSLFTALYCTHVAYNIITTRKDLKKLSI